MPAPGASREALFDVPMFAGQSEPAVFFLTDIHAAPAAGMHPLRVCVQGFPSSSML